MFQDEVVCIDLETTGLSPERDRIIDVGAVKFKAGKIVDTFESLVNPGFEIAQITTAITGISSADLKGAPKFEEIKDKLKKFIGKAYVLGHNVQFDLAFLEANGLALSNKRLDTFELTPIAFPGHASYALGYLTDKLEIEHEDKHRALSDSLATALLFIKIVEQVGKLDKTVLEKMQVYLAKASWPAVKIFEEALTDAKPRKVAARKKKGRQSKTGIKQLIDFDPKKVWEMFDEGGTLSKIKPHFEARSGQKEMVRYVLESLEEKEPVLIEAGTGIGKTLAYLVPLLAKSLVRKQKVLVATYTTSLQDQILQRDLGLLNEIFAKELGRELKVAVLKGRSHYLCLGAWDKLLHKVSFTDDEIRVIIKVLIWRQETETGERSELYLNREEQKVWYRIASDSDTCLGNKCWRKHDCFVNLAREKAKQADLIIVNQALLLTDTQGEKGIIPEYDYLVVDEAQHLEEVATDRYTQVFTTEALIFHLKELDDLLAAYLNNNSATLFSDQGLVSSLSELRTEIKNLLPRIDILEGFIGMLARFLQGRARNNFSNDYRINKEIENFLEWQKMLDSLKHVQHNLDLIADASQRLSSDAFRIKESDSDAEELVFSLEAWNEENSSWQNKISKVFFSSFDSKVMWLRQNRNEQSFIYAAPLQVSEFLSRELFTPDKQYLLTSATLAVGNDFSYFKKSLGIPAEVKSFVIPSDYDYEKQAAFFVPIDFPAPDNRDYAHETTKLVEELAKKLKGRTLVLFTSHRAMENAYAELAPLLAEEGIEVFAQGISGNRARILEGFKESERAIMLGTNSFWEGVDLPGEDLQAVIIAKLPFDVPSDPIYEARSNLYSNPFSDYALPRAILRFKQGIGRLIRSREDSGVLVILDNRIRTQSYGERFFLALPSMETYEIPAADIPDQAKRFIS